MHRKTDTLFACIRGEVVHVWIPVILHVFKVLRCVHQYIYTHIYTRKMHTCTNNSLKQAFNVELNACA
jgi:hypothetical protein